MTAVHVPPTGTPTGSQNVTVHRATLASRLCAVALLGLTAVLASAAWWGSRSLKNDLVLLFVLVTLAQMWNLLAGYAGLVSIGQQAFFGLGAYALIQFANLERQDIYFSLIPAALVSGLVAVPIALVAFRLRGAYFAIGTLVIADLVRLLVAKRTELGGGQGVTLDVSGYEVEERLRVSYLVGLGLAVGAMVLVYAVLRSRLGLALQAVRDDEAGARGLGADVYRTRFVVFVVAALWTGLAGATYHLNVLRAQPASAFSVIRWTAPIILIVVIGGLGTIEGPLLGAIAYWWIQDRFADQAEWYLIGLGIAAILFSLFLKEGLWGRLTRWFPQLQLFPVRRRLEIPGTGGHPRGAKAR